MFRKMRRIGQKLSKEACIRILGKMNYGVLAVLGDDGFPYTVPLNYVYAGEKIYFHWARTGHKLDAVRTCEKASFCVVEREQVVPERFTDAYRSVIAFGRIRILEEEAEIRRALELLMDKYIPKDIPGRENEMQEGIPRLYMAEMSIAHLTGKEEKSLSEDRQNTQEGRLSAF